MIKDMIDVASSPYGPRLKELARDVTLPKGYLHKLEELAHAHGFSSLDDIPQDDEGVIRLMLASDPLDYYLPALAGCLPYPLKDFYSLLDEVKPKNKEEFILLICLMESRYVHKEELRYSLECNELEFTICNVEGFFALLADELVEEDALALMEKICRSHAPLCEWEEELLQSHEIPRDIVRQFPNIKALPSIMPCIEMATLIYDAAYLSLRCGVKMECLPGYKRVDGFVGPFFYIDGEILGYKEDVPSFDPRRRFIDSDMSHFRFFDTLGIEGDYGNYPRGRVLYDAYHGRFVIYLDKSLRNEVIKEKIVYEYGIPNKGTLLRLDSHYCHDGL